MELKQSSASCSRFGDEGFHILFVICLEEVEYEFYL